MRVFSVLIISCFYCFGFSQQSEVSFVIKNFGINVDGQFKRFRIDITQDKTGVISSVGGVVYVNTIETGINARDEHLLKEEYFDALNHPEISLQSTATLPLNNVEYTIIALLNIKGITKTVSFKGALFQDVLGSRFQAEFEINRLDFNVGGGGVIGKAVKVKVTYDIEP